MCGVSSPEDSYIGAEKKAEQLKKVKKALSKLTEIQRKRYLLYTIQGLSTWQIADLEGTNQKSVYESLQAAEKKIGENFTNVTILHMLRNRAYLGILRSGETESEMFPELQIITPKYLKQSKTNWISVRQKIVKAATSL